MTPDELWQKSEDMGLDLTKEEAEVILMLINHISYDVDDAFASYRNVMVYADWDELIDQFIELYLRRMVNPKDWDKMLDYIDREAVQNTLMTAAVVYEHNGKVYQLPK